MNILFSVDLEHGTGHLTRCKTVQEALTKEGNRIDIIDMNETSAYLNTQWALLDVIILDWYDFPKDYQIDQLTELCKKLIIFTDDYKSHHIAKNIITISFSPNLGNCYHPNYRQGLNYFILDPKFHACKKPKVIKDKIENILVCFGGSDPQGYMMKVLNQFAQTNVDAQIHIIFGSHFNIERQPFPVLNNVILHHHITDLTPFMEEADLAICSAGNTLMELMYCGVPCIVLPQTERERDHAHWLRETIWNMKESQIETIEPVILFLDKTLRTIFSERSQQLVDGKGLERVLKIIEG